MNKNQSTPIKKAQLKRVNDQEKSRLPIKSNLLDKTKIAIVGYSRVSTENQKDEGTITLQKDAITEYCNDHFELREIFADEGVSGGLSDRPALVSLFEFLEKNHDIKSVLIFKLDRLARDLYIQEHLIKKLESMGVTLLSIKEPNLDSNDPMRKAFRQFMGIVSELEKNFITMRLTEGRKAKARKGLYAGGGVAFGYCSKDKELLIDSDKATIVKEIFRMRIALHYSYERIANILNEQGYPTMRGGKWNTGTIHYMIRNKVYRGIVEYSGESAKRSELALI